MSPELIFAATAFGIAALVVAVGIVRPPARVRALAGRVRDRLDRPVTLVLLILCLVALVRSAAAGAWAMTAVFAFGAALLARDLLARRRSS